MSAGFHISLNLYCYIIQTKLFPDFRTNQLPRRDQTVSVIFHWTVFHIYFVFPAVLMRMNIFKNMSLVPKGFSVEFYSYNLLTFRCFLYFPSFETWVPCDIQKLHVTNKNLSKNSLQFVHLIVTFSSTLDIINNLTRKVTDAEWDHWRYGRCFLRHRKDQDWIECLHRGSINIGGGWETTRVLNNQRKC